MEFFILLLLTVCFFSSCLHRVIKRLNDGWTNFLLHLRFAVFECVYINDCCCCSLDSYELFASDENCRRCEWFCWLLLTKNSAIFFSSFFSQICMIQLYWANNISAVVWCISSGEFNYTQLGSDCMFYRNNLPVNSISNEFLIKKLLVAYSLFCLGIVFLFTL